jgi:hypothetical protein
MVHYVTDRIAWHQLKQANISLVYYAAIEKHIISFAPYYSL